ncbi:MAG: FeoB-associated Cys-rich membrane protein [Ruminococcus sp.]|nr:FeoB-associated Cys-rich membrane protein [Ruminococcus sp.]
MDLLSIMIILFVAICFVLAVRYIYKNRGKGCNGNCSCCNGCSAKQRNDKN